VEREEEKKLDGKGLRMGIKEKTVRRSTLKREGAYCSERMLMPADESYLEGVKRNLRKLESNS